MASRVLKYGDMLLGIVVLWYNGEWPSWLAANIMACEAGESKCVVYFSTRLYNRPAGYAARSGVVRQSMSRAFYRGPISVMALVCALYRVAYGEKYYHHETSVFGGPCGDNMHVVDVGGGALGEARIAAWGGAR